MSRIPARVPERFFNRIDEGLFSLRCCYASPRSRVFLLVLKEKEIRSSHNEISFREGTTGSKRPITQSYQAKIGRRFDHRTIWAQCERAGDVPGWLGGSLHVEERERNDPITMLRRSTFLCLEQCE